jgi:hypothetical protein
MIHVRNLNVETSKDEAQEEVVGTEPRLIKGPHHADALSFMRRKPRGDKFGGVDHWVVERTGSFDIDCEKGRALAREYLDFIGTYPTVGNGTLLSCIVSDMVVDAVERGVDAERPWAALGRIESAFLREVNRYAMAAGMLCLSAGTDAKGTSD